MFVFRFCSFRESGTKRVWPIERERDFNSEIWRISHWTLCGWITYTCSVISSEFMAQRCSRYTQLTQTYGKVCVQHIQLNSWVAKLACYAPNSALFLSFFSFLPSSSSSSVSEDTMRENSLWFKWNLPMNFHYLDNNASSKISRIYVTWWIYLLFSSSSFQKPFRLSWKFIQFG